MPSPDWYSRQRDATHLIIILGNHAQLNVIDKCNIAVIASSIQRGRERAGKREREEQGVNAALSNERETKEEVLQKSCHSLQQRWTLTGVRSDVFAECHF